MKSQSTVSTESNTRDNVEVMRLERLETINADPGTREALELAYNQVWDTSELTRDFIVIGFAAPFVSVRRKQDSRLGSLEFQHHPRFYFNFRPD